MSFTFISSGFPTCSYVVTWRITVK